MDESDYISYTIECLKSIFLKVKGLDIIHTYKITTLNNIEFVISKRFSEKDFKKFNAEIMKSEVSNWMLFSMSGNSKDNYNYRLINLEFEQDVKRYNRLKGLELLI